MQTHRQTDINTHSKMITKLTLRGTITKSPGGPTGPGGPGGPGSPYRWINRLAAGIINLPNKFHNS